MLRFVAGNEAHEITVEKWEMCLVPISTLPMPRQSGLSQRLLKGGKVQSSLPYKN